MNSKLSGAGMVGVASLFSILACTSSTPSGPVGGPVTGTQDSHCGTTKQAWSLASCQSSPDAGTPDAAATDAAEPDGGASEYGETMFNQVGADDECKYDVSWTATSVYRDTDVTFTVTVKSRTDGTAVLDAEPDVEAFLGTSHAAPSTGKSTEKGGGVYTIGPVRFDQAGKWTVRFHFFDRCIDGPTSPHGHAAFFVSVP